VKDSVIKVENVSKQYRLGVLGTGTISHDLNRWWHLVRGKEDPYLKVGESNDRSKKGSSEYVWALKDINFSVEKGEVLGVIGKNGAGKSTLLKILSKVTTPSEGKITMKGRVASLLEVGTGFHPELTGKENIYLNGAILGMTKKEIDNKFDEIVEFSGCERYIDTPSKRYSSGMKVRLAFAVAAFLEPEILIVDEVLAVGDAEFQKKAIGKMKDVSSGGGRTVIFVSHNMNAIKTLCTSCIIMKNGKLEMAGPTDKMVEAYLNMEVNELPLNNKWSFENAPGNNKVKVLAYNIFSSNSKTKIELKDDLFFAFQFQFLQKIRTRYDVSLHIFNADELLVCILSSVFMDDFKKLEEGNEVTFKLPKHSLNIGRYTCTLRIIENRSNSSILKMDGFIGFTVYSNSEGTYFDFGGIFLPDYTIN
jgi:lipopolysaccharide transport system ATP-binding protein